MSTTYQTIVSERRRRAAVITLNRPDKRNAISFQMMDELQAALAQIAGDADARAVVITGGSRFFSSGMDLNALVGRDSPARFNEYMIKWRQLNKALEEHPKPVIAAIEGYCYTGGLELALACDLRVGGSTAQFTITSSKIGTVPGAGGTQRLPRIVGIANALDILFSADPIGAERAYQIGLINRLAAAGESLSVALAMADIYAERAPLSLQWAKRAVYSGMQMPLGEAIEFEAFIVNTIYRTNDKQEGISSFLEKRPPKFTGT